MPPRTNLFQQVVTALYAHIAEPGQTVTQSEEFPHTSGSKREVDVVIRGSLGGHPMIVGVEATATGRKVDITWVESRLKKHEKLPTNLLVLVSEAGFYQPAEDFARQEGAVTITPSDLQGDEVGTALLRKMTSVVRCDFQVRVDKARIVLGESNDGPTIAVLEVLPHMRLFDRAGNRIGNLTDLMVALIESKRESVLKHLSAFATGATVPLQRAFGPPWLVAPGCEHDEVFGRPHSTDGPMHLVLIKGVLVIGSLSWSVENLELEPINFDGRAYSYNARDHQGGTEIIVGTINADGVSSMSIHQVRPKDELVVPPGGGDATITPIVRVDTPHPGGPDE